MPSYKKMTAIDGLVRRVAADVRKSWVDYFKNIERLQIRDAFDAGVAHANETPKALQLTGSDYYKEIFLSGGEDPYPVDQSVEILD
jgi:hypothetical protein